jgi:hypothetical protein
MKGFLFHKKELKLNTLALLNFGCNLIEVMKYGYRAINYVGRYSLSAVYVTYMTKGSLLHSALQVTDSHNIDLIYIFLYEWQR